MAKTTNNKQQTTNNKQQTPNNIYPELLSKGTPNTKHQTPNTKHQTPNTKHQTPNTKHQTPNTEQTNNKQKTTKKMSTWKSYQEIEVWQLARIFCQKIYKIMQTTGLSTDFGLKDQINRSSGSIMDNIAEGYGRDGKKEFINFLAIAKASANEASSQLFRIYDRNYITESEIEILQKDITEIINKIGGLMAYLNKSDYKGIKFKNR